MAANLTPKPPPEPHPPSGTTEALLRSIAAEFELAIAQPDAVDRECGQLRARLGATDSTAFQSAIRQLLPLLRKRAGPVARPVFDLLAAGLVDCDDPWALLEGMFAARDPALVRRALELALEHAGSGKLTVDRRALLVLARAVDVEESPLGEPQQLASIGTLLEPPSAEALPGRDLRDSDLRRDLRGRDPLRMRFVADPDPAVRRLAARGLDLQGEPPTGALARRILGSEAHRFLAPYLEFTRASHLDLLTLVEAPDTLAGLIASLRRAALTCDPGLLKEVIATLGWSRIHLGLEVEPIVNLSVTGSFSLTASPAEAALLESTGTTHRTGEAVLFFAHGGRRAGGAATARGVDAVARFRATNLLHAEVLADILDLTPLTREKVLRILDRMDRIVADFTTLFAAHSEEAVALPEVYAKLRERIVSELESHGAEVPLSAELTRRVQMFEDPAALAEVHTLHGLKRYLHQQGLRLGMRLVERGAATDRSVDVVLAAAKKPLHAIRTIRYVDFEPLTGTAPGAMPFAAATIARAFARQLVAGCVTFPSVEIFCYGNEVHYYLAFANHPVFLRIDYSPPLLGGMVDLEFYGVSKYELDAHPNPQLDAIGVLFRRLEFDVVVEHTHVHARFDKERSLDLGTLCQKAEAVLRLAPALMDLDWVIGQLALPEAARCRVAEAWADFFVDWGVLPMPQVLAKDRLGILLGVEQGPTGEREIVWSGEGPYRDRFTRTAPAGFFDALHDALSRLGLAVEPEIGTLRLGQLELERTFLRPLRQGLQSGQLHASADGFQPAAPDLFALEHEAEIFAILLHNGGEEFVAATRMAALVAPLERGLRFRTTGAVQGCPVQRARLVAPGDSLELYVLRDAAGMIQLAFFGRGDTLWRRRAHAGAAWECNRSAGAAELAAFLRTARYLTPGMEAPAPAGDPEALQARLRNTLARRSQPLPGERIVGGLRASPGRAVGKVVLETAHRAPREFDAAVLVAPIVRPEDSAAIYHAAGVVSTGGGILSHAGLIAAQFHKPALIVSGRWESGRDGAPCLVYRTTEFVEAIEDVNGLRVTLRRDLHEREHRLQSGDLVVLDADEGTLRVLGSGPEVLGLHGGFRLLRAAAERLRQASEAHDVLVQRGERLRARHQIEKLLGRLVDPVLARFAVEEVLLGGAAAGGTGAGENVALLSTLLCNRKVGDTTRDLLHQTASELFQRDRAAFEAALGDIPASESMVEILSLRVDALHARNGLEVAIAALQAAGTAAPAPDPADAERLDAVARPRLQALRDAGWSWVEDALPGTTHAAGLRIGAEDPHDTHPGEHDPRLRHRLRQIERFDRVLGATETMRTRLDTVRNGLAARDEAARRRLAQRSILFPEECGHEVAELIGWKAANLAEIERLAGSGRTPPWFVVTHRVFEQMLASPRRRKRAEVEPLVPGARTLGEAIDACLARSDLDDARKSACIRELWQETPLPPGIAETLGAAYGRWASDPANPPYVAVRSSAGEEDTEVAARAGEFETFLFVRGQDALCDHLRRAWSGLWTERAIHNRAVLGPGAGRLGGGVIIQCIVRSRVSGVLQTVHVAERNLREMVVNAGLGLGAGVVSGSVGADQIVVAKEGDLLHAPLRFRYITGDKREQVVFDARAGTGTTRVACLYHQRFRPALEYVELCELVRIATRLESAYAQPLDLEFGIEANRLWILQARPVPLGLAVLSETVERSPLRPIPSGACRPLQGVAHDPT